MVLLDKLNHVASSSRGGGLVSDQVHTLWEVLQARAVGPDHRSMVFVKTRMGCRCLIDYFSLLPDLKGRCGMVVGTASESGAPLHGLSSCAKTFQAFRDGTIEVGAVQS